MFKLIFCAATCHPARVTTLGRLALLAALTTSCFGTVNDPVRHYYTLHLEPLHRLTSRHVPGLVRVRDLDAEAAYDRFQLVMRRNPFELSYRQKEVWAVKPQRMISDLIARGLVDQGLFSGVTRELGERRPNYLLSGELHAIEVYDSRDTWFAHLAMTWQITDFEAGKTLWTYNYDDRKQVAPGDFARAVRAISELLTRAIELGLTSMQNTRFADSAPLAPGMPANQPILPEDGMAVPRGAPSGMPPPGEPVGHEALRSIDRLDANAELPPHSAIDMPARRPAGGKAPTAPSVISEPEASPLRPQGADQPPPGELDDEVEGL